MHTLKRTLLTALCLFAAPVFATTSLTGVWKYHHAKGSPCKQLIGELYYHFHENGAYEVQAKMRRFGGMSDEKARGTYTIQGNTITTQVDGQKIGPLRFRFDDDFLVFEQQQPRCDIFLVLEDR
jgi:hypothetical protein